MASSHHSGSGGGGPFGFGQRRAIGEPFRPIAASLRLPRAHVAAIDDSHDRCAAQGLSRFETPDLSLISRSDFAIMRERNTRLYAHAAPVMEMLFEQIETTQSMVVLTDATGTVLHSVGDDDFLSRASKVALQPGVNWSEATKGTNAIGTALVSEQPTLVHADEHFMHANHFLTCSSAPILDPRGNVLGVLDVSGDHRSYHQHTMALVKMSARMIENHWLQDDYRDVMRLHFHTRVDFIGTLKEGILAITADGRIVGANRSALDQLGMNGAALRKQDVKDLLGVSVGHLVEHFRSPLAAPFSARVMDGTPLHLLARFDWPVWHKIAEAASGNSGNLVMEGWRAALPTGSGSGPAPLEPRAKTMDVSSPSTAPTQAEAPRAEARDSRSMDRAEASPSGRFKLVADELLQQMMTGDAQVSDALSKARRVVDRGMPMLVVGERGSGKSLFAQVLHHVSSRRDMPFVSLSCSAMQPELIDIELFGPGGKLLQARGGTLYLDEVGELPTASQLRLLRVLQDKQVLVSGVAQPPIRVDVALICSTSVSLRERVAAQRFRDDLYYRLHGLSLKLPALRDRDDLLTLAKHILAAEASSRTGAGLTEPLTLSDEVVALFGQSQWPGNVRQLKVVLRAASALVGEGCVIGRDHLPYELIEEVEAQSMVAAAAAGSTSTLAPARVDGEKGSQGSSLDDIELDAIRRTVEACSGNISEASKRLGISRNTIYRKLRWRRPDGEA